MVIKLGGETKTVETERVNFKKVEFESAVLYRMVEDISQKRY